MIPDNKLIDKSFPIAGNTMNSIYSYSEYRDFIRDCLAEKRRKCPGFSHRAAALKLGLNSGTLTRIINGTRHLGPSLLSRFVEFLGLRRKEAEYFTLLVNFSRSSDLRKKREYFLRMSKMRKEKRTVVAPGRHEFFRRWYHAALYQLLRIVPCISDPEELGALLLPPVSGPKARKTLETLEKLGFILRDERNGYRPIEQSLTTGESWQAAAIHDYQVQSAKAAAEALVRLPKEERDFSTLTVSLSSESFEKARNIIERARHDINSIDESETSPERVYQCNFQLFPISKPSGDPKEVHHENPA